MTARVPVGAGRIAVGCSPAEPSPRRRRRDLLVVAAVTLLLLVPFVAKPLHVDDPLFVWSARQIVAHPLDPYGFAANWAGWSQPFSAVTQNPPGGCYLLAAIGRVGGWGEVALHVGLLPVAVLTAVGTYLLAAEFCRRPVWATVLAMASPAVLVSATSLMCDVPMLCLWVWAVALWVWGSAAERPGRAVGLLAGAVACAAAGVLTKYPAIDLVPLLAAQAVLCPARRGSTRAAQAVALAVPVAALVAWNRASAGLYGAGAFTAAVEYARRVRATESLAAGTRALDTLCFVGGAALTAAAVAAVAVVQRGAGGGRAVRVIAVAVTAAVLGGLASAACRTPTGWRGPAGPPAWAYFAQYGTLAAAGVAVLAAAGVGVGPAGDRRRGLFLLAWVAGVFAFAAVMNWTVNVRSVLPLVPAACILVVRATDRDQNFRPAWVAATLAAAVAVTMAVSEYRVAAANRDVAVGHAGARVWFTGHWGFQYYMQRGGARPVEADGVGLAAGDTVVLPLNNDGPARLPAGADVLVRVEAGNGYWLSLTSNPMGGGFYSSYGDRLPVVFGPVPAEAFWVARVGR